jgi:hypothetical protein
VTTLDLEPDTANARMRVLVQSPQGGDLERLDPDGVWRPVRGGAAITVDSLIDDYEHPLGVDVTYRLDGVTATGRVDGVSSPWITHPTRPDLNRAVTLVDDDDWQWSAPGTVHEPVDSEYPVVVWTRRTVHRGMIELTSTWADRGAIKALLADGSPLLLRVPPGCFADDSWIWAETVRRRKSRRYDPAAIRWELEYQRVDDPGGVIVLDPTNSWGATTASHPSWTDLAADHGDWVDVLLTAHPHA